MTERYEPTIAPTAKKQLAEQLPESVASTANEFIIGALVDNPLRVGKRLRSPLHDRYSLVALRRALGRHDESVVAGAQPSTGACPIRCTDGAAGQRSGPNFPLTPGTGIVRASGSTCLPSLASTDDVGDWRGHPHRGSPLRMGSGRRRIPNHRRCYGGSTDAFGRTYRDRASGSALRLTCRLRRSRCSTWRPRACPASATTTSAPRPPHPVQVRTECVATTR